MSDIAAIEARHGEMLDEFGNWRCRCGDDWPCETEVMRRERDEWREKVGKTWGTIIDTHREEVARYREDADRLAEALRVTLGEDGCCCGQAKDGIEHPDYCQMPQDALAAHEALTGEKP